jgi:hypothetical protein
MGKASPFRGRVLPQDPYLNAIAKCLDGEASQSSGHFRMNSSNRFEVPKARISKVSQLAQVRTVVIIVLSSTVPSRGANCEVQGIHGGPV